MNKTRNEFISLIVVFIFFCVSSRFSFLFAEERFFVKDGKITDASRIGNWDEKESSLVGQGEGTAFLYANRMIGEGDFSITIKIMLELLNESAASICFNNNSIHFGFDGRNNSFFAEGQLFKRIFGNTETHFSKIDSRISAGKPFNVLIARVKETVTVTIEGHKVFEYRIGTQPLGIFALRPHRSRMHVYDFAANGSLLPLPEQVAKQLASRKIPSMLEMNFPPEVQCQILFRQGKQFDGYNNIRIPAICKTKKGTLLAFAEGRVAGDADKIETILRRSEDSGKTWSPIQIVWRDNDETCGNPCPVCDEITGTVWLFGTWNRGVDIEPKIMEGTSNQPRIPYLMKSDDDGKTWSQAQKMPQLRLDNWGWYATGPCNAIQLTRGQHKNRLVIPANHSVIDGKLKWWERCRSHVIYSDDHGKSWRFGGSTEPYVNESTVVELEDGSVMMNMRSYHEKDCRAVAISRNGGESFPVSGMATGSNSDDAYLDYNLVSPVCQANILRYSWAKDNKPGIILYAGPNGKERERLTVWMSEDDGKTWKYKRLVYDGPAAYSNLVALPENQVGLLCEIGPDNPYQTISLLTFPLSWIAGN
ncbi:MAG: glycoside hydrolase [Planctomycetaceae bacterium]|jgi:sialidase-1|nr:glycoside hydrolase [Planctomycetaceae bacterium]